MVKLWVILRVGPERVETTEERARLWRLAPGELGIGADAVCFRGSPAQRFLFVGSARVSIARAEVHSGLPVPGVVGEDAAREHGDGLPRTPPVCTCPSLRPT